MLDIDLEDSDPKKLANLLDPQLRSMHAFHQDELAALLQHHLEAPMQVDLGGLPDQWKGRLKNLSEADGLLLKSLGELLSHPCPPVELLAMTKDYAKTHRQHPDSQMPNEIATLLYWACIAVALVRCNQRITTQSDIALRSGLEQMLSYSWLSQPMRNLLQEGLAYLISHEPGHTEQ